MLLAIFLLSNQTHQYSPSHSLTRHLIHRQILTLSHHHDDDLHPAVIHEKMPLSISDFKHGVHHGSYPEKLLAIFDQNWL